MRVQCERMMQMRGTCALLDLRACVIDMRDPALVRVHGGGERYRGFALMRVRAETRVEQLMRQRREEHTYEPETGEDQRRDLARAADPMKRARGLHETKAVRSLL